MTGFEYGNARLHAMKSRLLSAKDLEALIGSGSLQGLIASLTRTVYHQAVENALARTTGMDCIHESLHKELIETFGRISSFYHGKPGKVTSIILRSNDIHNVKTILRALSKNVPAGDIIDALMPVGDVPYDSLNELAGLRDPRAAMVDFKPGWGNMFAFTDGAVSRSVQPGPVLENETTLIASGRFRSQDSGVHGHFYMLEMIEGIPFCNAKPFRNLPQIKTFLLQYLSNPLSQS